MMNNNSDPASCSASNSRKSKKKRRVRSKKKGSNSISPLSTDFSKLQINNGEESRVGDVSDKEKTTEHRRIGRLTVPEMIAFNNKMLELAKLNHHSDDDIEFLPAGVKKKDEELWAKYFKQIEESEGFDIEDYPGMCVMAYIEPYKNFTKHPEFYDNLIILAKLAIEKYNKQHKTEYEFVHIDKLNVSGWCSVIYYITFSVRNLKAAAGQTDAHEVFQAQVEETFKKNIVRLCRPKP